MLLLRQLSVLLSQSPGPSRQRSEEIARPAEGSSVHTDRADAPHLQIGVGMGTEQGWLKSGSSGGHRTGRDALSLPAKEVVSKSEQ